MTIKLQDLVSELKLEDKLTPASKTALSSLKGLSIGVGLVTAAVGVAVAGFGKMVEMTFDWANQLDNIQDVMGGTTKQAAALNFVVQKSGVDLGTFTQGMTILEKGLVTTEGSLDVTGKKLAEFGINAFDVNGKVKDQTVLLGEISNKYSSFSTQQERVNFLTEAFGKSGAGLIDFFDTLAQEGGIDAAADKAERLGLAIDPEKYEKFQRNLAEIKLAGQGLAMTIVDKLMPAFTRFSEWWSSDGIQSFMGLIDDVGTTFDLVSQLGQNIEALTSRMGLSSETASMWQGILTATASPLTTLSGILREINKSLMIMNGAIELGIKLWDAFIDGMSQIKNFVIPKPPSSSGHRATGGAVLGGVGYDVVELGRPEVFTPNTSGRIDPMKPQTVTAKIDEFLLGRIIGSELAKVLG